MEQNKFKNLCKSKRELLKKQTREMILSQKTLAKEA